MKYIKTHSLKWIILQIHVQEKKEPYKSEHMSTYLHYLPCDNCSNFDMSAYKIYNSKLSPAYSGGADKAAAPL